MSIFGTIASAIFGTSPAKTGQAQPLLSGGAMDAPAAAGGGAAGAKPTVDVAAVLDKLDENSDQDLDWRVSIVDLMKLLKLDSSLTARKQLATELKFTGNMGDSAAMNVWLHKQVMTKLAENGGIVPAELKH